jgi:uroporphyrinogen III methyltransferase/synthase
VTVKTRTPSPTPGLKQPATVAFVGAGPGDPGLLTVRALDVLSRADAVVIDQVAREDVVSHVGWRRGRRCRER